MSEISDKPEFAAGFEAPVPSMETIRSWERIVVRGEESRDPQYRYAGALVMRDGELMVITSVVPNQFHPRADLLQPVE